MGNITSVQFELSNGSYISRDDVDFPIFIKKSVDGTHKEGRLTISEQSSAILDPPQAGFNQVPYNKYTRVIINTSTGAEQFVIDEDIVTQPESLSAGYVHTIRLADPLKALEGCFMADLTNVKPLQPKLATANDFYTFKTAIERVFAVTPLRLTGSQPLYGLDNSVKEQLNAIPFPESFPRANNLLEFITTAGRYLSAVPYMTDWNTVSFRFLDDVNNSAGSIDYNLYESSRDSQYCTNIDVTLENVIAENDDEQGSIVFPARNGWASFRTRNDQVRMTNDNRVFKVPYNIIKPIRLLWRFNDTVNVYVFDLTDYLVEENVYNNISRTLKRKRIIYKQYSNIIDGFWAFEKVIGWIATPVAIFEILKEVLDTQTDLNEAQQESITNSGNIGKWLRNSMFRFEYIPAISNIRTQIDREPDADFKRPHSYVANQTDTQVSSQAYGAYLEQTIERMGKREVKYSVVTQNYSSLPQTAYNYQIESDTYYVTDVSTLIYDNNIESEILLTKDFNAISERIGLNAMPRATEITTNGVVKRCDIYKEYCILTREGAEANTSNYNSSWTISFITSLVPFLWEDDGIEINFAIVNIFNKLGGQIVQGLLPCNSFAMGKELIFNFAFENNYNLGSRVLTDGSERDVVSVGYNDSLGRFENMRVRLATRLPQELTAESDLNALPQIGNHLVPNANNTIVDLNQVIYKKNVSESPSFSYQLSVKTYDKELIIGEMFTQRNPLVSDTTSDYVGLGGLGFVLLYSPILTYSLGSLAHFNDIVYIYINEESASGKQPDIEPTYWKAVRPLARQHTYSGGVWSQQPGNYVKINNGYYIISAFRRYNYNPETDTFTQNDSGAFLRYSRDSRLVKLTRKLKKNEKGRIIFNAFVNETMTLSSQGVSFGDPAPSIGGNYKSWAILDEKDRLIIGGNYQTLEPIYFNFKNTIY